jgi:hypothetical protein
VAAARCRAALRAAQLLGAIPLNARWGASAGLGERSGAPSGLRPSSFVICNTPVEVKFTSAGCLNYPCRTPPHAAILFDKFHILKHLGDALDKVRKQEYATLDGEKRKFIKGQKYALLSHKENLEGNARTVPYANFPWL